MLKYEELQKKLFLYNFSSKKQFQQMKTETRKKEKETHMKSNHHASQMYQKQAKEKKKLAQT